MEMQRAIATTFAILLLAALNVPAQSPVAAASKDDWEEINFEFNSAVLTDGFPSLLKLAELLNQNAGYKVKLDGHTDWVGSAGYNQKLSERRVEAVRTFLQKYGARPNQIEAAALGKNQPKVDNKTREGRFINRRVAMTLTDASGKVIGSGGIGDVIKAMQQVCPDYSAKLDDILRRLDKLDAIARALEGLKSENEKLRADLDALKGVQQKTTHEVATLPRITPQDVETSTRKVVADELQKQATPKFSILGMNFGLDNTRNLTFTGRGRYFSVFKENFAIQAQGEYMYFRDRQEGQADFGLVNRFSKHGQVGGFASFRNVAMLGMQESGTLGQASMTLDYIFRHGRVGLFGSKGFMNNAVVNRAVISRNILEERFLRIVDQIGASTAVTVGRNTMLEGNIGALFVHGAANRPGGTIRLIQPLNQRVAFTLEGGLNESFIGRDYNGRVVAGLLFGNFVQPREYLAMDQPVPVDVPRVRFEMLTRRIRTGNDSPVADAGADQVGVPAGTVTLDGSASFDPDGDPITFQWDQIAGPAVSLSGRNTARATFPAAEGQNYSFRLTVRDDKGAASLARVSVSVREVPRVVIQRFTATPATIRPGDASTLAWQVLNADDVEISPGVGRVNPQAGTIQVTPAETTTYRLVARNRAGEITETVQVVVEQPRVRILAFRAQPETIRRGERSLLVWETENADAVTITTVGSVRPTGSASVSPTATTTYTLTATNRFGSVSATATVRVEDAPPPPAIPRILVFNASPPEIGEGESSTLNWEVVGAETVVISEIGERLPRGSHAVSPTRTTSYTLVARNAGGEARQTVTVTFIPTARIASFTASPLVTARPGDPSRLTWETSGAEEVTITPGVGTVAPSGSVDVTPLADTTYTLTARGRRNTATRTVAVRVTPLPPPNRPPSITLNVPGDMRVIDSRFAIDASRSADPDGDPLTFNWRIVSASPGIVAVVLFPDRAGTEIRIASGLTGEMLVEVAVSDGTATVTRQVRVQINLNRSPQNP
jgi:hypothetical protein